MPEDVTQKYLEHIYNRVRTFVQTFSLETPEFTEVCELFDKHKTTYCENWIKKFFSEEQAEIALKILKPSRI